MNLYSGVQHNNLYQCIDQKEQSINCLQQERQNARIDRSRSNTMNGTLLSKIDDLEHQIRALQHSNQQLHKQISQLQRDNDELKLQSQSEGCFKIELEHLRCDNSRLLSNLKNIQENHSKADKLNIHNSDILNGLRFLSAIQNSNSNNKLPEQLLWVPKQAYEIAHKFRDEYKDSEYLGDEQIQLMLFEINKVWSLRELEQNKCKQKQFNIEKLKISNRNRAPLNEHMLTQNINRLQGQVKQLQKENIDLYVNRKGLRASSTQEKRKN